MEPIESSACASGSPPVALSRKSELPYLSRRGPPPRTFGKIRAEMRAGAGTRCTYTGRRTADRNIDYRITAAQDVRGAGAAKESPRLAGSLTLRARAGKGSYAGASSLLKPHNARGVCPSAIAPASARLIGRRRMRRFRKPLSTAAPGIRAGPPARFCLNSLAGRAGGSYK